MDIIDKYKKQSEDIPKEERDPPRLSHGTDPAIRSIIEKIQNKEVDTVCINIATLIRNLLEKDMNIDTAVTTLMDNMTLIVDDLSIAFSGSNINNPYIYFYLMPTHRMIPSMRSPAAISKEDPIGEYFAKTINSSKTRKMVFDVSRHYVRYRSSQRIPTVVNQQANNLFITTQIVNEGIFITNDSSLNIRKIADDPSYNVMYKMICSFKNTRKPIIMTHQPLDVHLLEKYPGFIVNSFTGKILTYKDCGSYFFGNDHIPFTRITHVCFGDKELVTGCLKSREKKAIIELAEKEKWRLLSSLAVDNKLKEKYKLPYALI